jgi:hypothetical protein
MSMREEQRRWQSGSPAGPLLSRRLELHYARRLIEAASESSDLPQGDRRRRCKRAAHMGELLPMGIFKMRARADVLRRRGGCP